MAAENKIADSSKRLVSCESMKKYILGDYGGPYWRPPDAINGDQPSSWAMGS